MTGLKINCLIALLSLLITGTARATISPSDDYFYRVFFDTDSDQATGCAVAAHDANYAGPVPGIEYVVSAAVERFASGAIVEEIFLQKCTAGILGGPTPIDPGDWDVGLENGTGGADVVEFYVPRSAIGNPGSATLAFHATQEVGFFNDVLLTTDGSNDGERIILPLPRDQPVPVLSGLSLLLCIAVLSLIAARGLRRHRTVAVAAVALSCIASAAATAWAVTIALDGQINDWASTPVLANDATGDSSINDPAEDIVAAFAAIDAQNIYFRMDLVNLAPTVCQNGILEPGEQCETVEDCYIEFETLGQGGGGGACSCVSCQCQGLCAN